MKKSLAIMLLIMLAMGINEKIIYVNVTDSLPYGLYVRVPQGKLEKGDYVVYEPTEEIKEIIRQNGWGEGDKKFLKRVSGTEGDEYEVDEKHKIFLVNGKYAGQVFERDSKGKELPKMRGKFKVGEGEILPMGTSLRSFDGRYTGTIKAKEIEAKVIPVLVKEGEAHSEIAFKK